VAPSDHGEFPADKLMNVWKELLKEYDTVLVNFMKSGNHESSFTKAAVTSFLKKGSDASSIASDSVLNNDDDFSDGDDDEFGMENGGWCCFTNSLPIIYLCMWLNEKPNLTSFVSRQILADVQLDTGHVNASKKQRVSDGSVSAKSNKNTKKLSNEQVAEALIGYIKVKETVAVQPGNIIVTHYMESWKVSCTHSQQKKKLSYWKSRFQSLQEECSKPGVMMSVSATARHYKN
jgi:hypothetical protein